MYNIRYSVTFLFIKISFIDNPIIKSKYQAYPKKKVSNHATV